MTVSRAIYYENKALVLMYHGIVEEPGDYTITPERLGEHLAALQLHGYRIISMKQFVAFKRGQGSLPPNAVLLTFDDGWKNFYQHAYPKLLEAGAPATNFVIVSRVVNGQRNTLSWEEMRQMMRRGMSFYSHTYDQHRRHEGNATLAHPVFLADEGRMETAREYEARVRSDLLLAGRLLERELGVQPRLLCFPFGAYNDTVIRIGRELGIELFFTVRKGVNTRERDEVYRINAGNASITAPHLLELLQYYGGR